MICMTCIAFAEYESKKQTVTEIEIKKIALLLPLSGPLASAGYAVMRGFLASYYHHVEEFVVNIFDTHALGVKTAITKALHSGADCCIGPLGREEVKQAKLYINRRIPWLLLNKCTPNHKSAFLFQFALPVESEINVIVESLDQLGYQYPGMIHYENDFGKRIKNQFTTKWTACNHDFIFFKSCDMLDNLTLMTLDALFLKESQSRCSALEKYLGHTLRYNLRYRQDIDCLFFQANAQLLSQIIPLLRYYFVFDLPFIGLSSVSLGIFEKQQDLNGLYFLAAPWQLRLSSQMNLLKQAIPDFHTHTFDTLSLYAFGMDIALVLKNLPHYFQNENMILSGETGVLTISRARVISNKRKWATIRNGRAVLQSLPKRSILNY
ncbi:MAG: hypothetical protein HAW62_06320 [Endozoicomonadaceae bacterium]|nr:hypothetical protein [Endozoicomonadaceae bacterium]